MKRDAWKKHISKKTPLLTPVAVKRKGGYPRGTRPGDGGLADGGSGGVAEGRAAIPYYTVDEAIAKLERGYKMEVVFDPTIKKTLTNILAGKSIIAKLRTEVRAVVMEKVPLTVVENSKHRTVWGYNYAAPSVKESVETAMWDVPFVQQIIGRNPFDKYAEDEEEQSTDKESLADKIADEILSVKQKPGNKKEKVKEIVDEIADKEEIDPSKAGLIRFVQGAHLVYKRQVEDGSYEELWIYPISKDNSGHKIKKAIIAGTDIDIDSEQSEDGKQTCELWTAGNAQLLKIQGLPN